MKITAYVLAVILAVIILPATAWAHCDTLRGPVVADGRLALDTADLTPALKWIKQEHESELRNAFKQALLVRSKGPDAKEIADRYFFETLVRLHRAGENAPFTGLKDEPVEGPIAIAEHALETGSANELEKQTSTHVVEELRQRFAALRQAREHADQSVSAGREYVARYIEFMHYIERLHAFTSAEHEQVPPR